MWYKPSTCTFFTFPLPLPGYRRGKCHLEQHVAAPWICSMPLQPAPASSMTWKGQVPLSGTNWGDAIMSLPGRVVVVIVSNDQWACMNLCLELCGLYTIIHYSNLVWICMLQTSEDHQKFILRTEIRAVVWDHVIWSTRLDMPFEVSTLKIEGLFLWLLVWEGGIMLGKRNDERWYLTLSSVCFFF